MVASSAASAAPSGGGANPLLTVVVLAWDALSYTRRCVESIRRTTTVPYELVVVDNGSAPAARDYAAVAADVAVLNERNLGFAAGMNRGLEVARGEYVAFVNNDITLPARWAELLLETAGAHPGAGLVVPALTGAGNARTVRREVGPETETLRPFEQPPSAVVYVMRTETVRALGGWGEEFAIASGEDADLAFKVWVNDLEVVFDRRVLVDHVGKVTASRLPNWRELWRRNGLQFVAKWQNLETEVPRLRSCPEERFERNRRIAASTAEWMERYFVQQELAHPLRGIARRRLPAAEHAVRRLRHRMRSIRERGVDRRRPTSSSRMGYLSLQSTQQWQGAHTHVHEVVAGLRRRGWEVELHQPDYPLGEHSPGVVQRLWQFLVVQVRLMAAGTIDVLYVRHHPIAVVAAVWAGVTRTPRFEEVNGTLEDFFVAHPWSRPLSVPLAAASRRSLRTADAVITPNAGLAEWVTATSGTGAVHVIPNGVNLQRFAPGLPTSYELPGRYVVFTGALVEWEGVETLLEAVQSPPWPDGVQLVIAGDGLLRPQVEAVARTAGSVHYLGAIPYDQVGGLIARSAASISPNTRTQWGASPLKLYEAMACGVPIVASDTAGQAEIVRAAGCGYLFTPGSAPALAEAVRAVVRDPEEAAARGARGLALAVAEHTWDHRVGKLERIMRGIHESARS